jgi:transposase
MKKYYIKEEKWQKIYLILKSQNGIRVKNESKTRLFLESLYFILKTGSQWRELPYFYRKWQSVRKRYEAWCRKGFWNLILQEFSKSYDGESIMIDATIIRAHPCAAARERTG